MLVKFLSRYTLKQIILLIIEDHLQFLLAGLPSYEGILIRRYLYILFIGLGKKSIIFHHVIFTHGFNIIIGEFFSINSGSHLDGRGGIKIGDYVLVGPNVFIASSNHVIHTSKPRINLPPTKKPTLIGSNVWIGANSVICPGVSIGNNSIVGAGSVVIKNIPANVVVAGNPARLIKTV